MKLSLIYKKLLKEYSIDPADLIILIERVVGISKEEFWSHGNSIEVNKTNIKLLNSFSGRLAKNEPISYLTGEKEFYSEKFFVDKAVLIPRPETELLVEIILDESDKSSNILEIGPGSGIVSILVAKLIGAKITAVEIDTDALNIFEQNIKSHKVGHLITPVNSDLFPPELEQFDIIVSNPPYLSERAFENADLIVRDHEPVTALLGGKHGHEVIKKIIEGSPSYLCDGGKIFLEIGYDQKDIIQSLLERNGFKNIKFYKDLNGIPRVVKALI